MTPRARRALLLLLVVMVAPMHLGAQAPTDIRPGDRLRVRHRGGPSIGAVISLTPESLTLQAADGGQPAVVAVSGIRTVDRSLGRRSRPDGALAGMGKGALVGAGAGLLIGVIDGGNSGEGDFIEFTATETIVYAMAIFGSVGAVLGLVTGAIAPGDRWERLPLEHLRASVTPNADRLRLGVQVSF